MPTRTSGNSSPNAGQSLSTTPILANLPGGSPTSSELDTLIASAGFELSLGVVTSGLCATPEAQAVFDTEEAGKPPRQGRA